MLGKLIKHEFKASGRTMLPFILVCLGLSVLAGLSTRAMDSQQDYGWFTVIFGIVIFLFVVGIIAVLVMALVVCIERFRKNLLGDEGYLMFTLPVSVDTHIFAKLIVSAVWFVVTWLVCMLAVALMLMCNVDKIEVNWADFSFAMGQLWKELVDFGVLHIVGYFLEILALCFVTCCVTCLQFYCAMAIGYSFSNHKVFLSVVFFFVISVVLSVIQPMWVYLLDSIDSIHVLDAPLSGLSNAGSVHVGMLMLLVYLLIHAVVLYIPTRLMLKHRLNLP